MTNEYRLDRKVLVTQAGGRIGYIVTYSLGLKGVQVYCADTSRICMTRFSRYCRGYYKYPSPHANPDGYFQTLNRLIDCLGINHLFPAYDESIFLSKHRERLLKPDVLMIPPYEKVLTLHNKPSLYELCRHLGCNVPRTIYLNEPSDLDHAIKTLSFPLVLKPERGGGGWGLTFAQNCDECWRIWEAFDQELHGNRLFAQEFIPGKLYGHGVLCHKGKILASNTYYTCRQHPIGRGTPTFRKGVIIEEIENQAALILEYLQWDGVCQMDFIVDSRDGRAVLLDANPRFWGSTAHGLASNINFPFLLYLLASGQHDGHTTKGFGEGPTSTWAWGDLIVMVQRLLKYPGKRRILLEHLVSWKETYFDELHKEDPLPFLLYPLQKAMSFVFKEKEGGF